MMTNAEFLEQILAEFERCGKKASFHYADDTCQEWDLADAAKNKAVILYRKYPQLQSEMQERAKHFLWSLEREVER